MNKENVELVKKWWAACWTQAGFHPETLRNLAAADIIWKYPLHAEKRGADAIIEELETMQASFPDLDFQIVGDMISDGKYVVVQWIGGGTHTGVAFRNNPFKIEIPAASGRKIHFGGTTIFTVENGKIVSEFGQEGAIDVALQLELVAPVK